VGQSYLSAMSFRHASVASKEEPAVRYQHDVILSRAFARRGTVRRHAAPQTYPGITKPGSARVSLFPTRRQYRGRAALQNLPRASEARRRGRVKAHRRQPHLQPLTDRGCPIQAAFGLSGDPLPYSWNGGTQPMSFRHASEASKEEPAVSLQLASSRRPAHFTGGPRDLPCNRHEGKLLDS
jgi:hypothetical protein